MGWGFPPHVCYFLGEALQSGRKFICGTDGTRVSSMTLKSPNFGSIELDDGEGLALPEFREGSRDIESYSASSVRACR